MCKTVEISVVLLFLNARTHVTELKGYAIGAHKIHALVFNCPRINAFFVCVYSMKTGKQDL